MIDLSNYVIVAELKAMTNLPLPISLKQKSILLNHKRFIEKKYLKDTSFFFIISSCQNLSGYLPLRYIATEVGISAKAIEHRLTFMRKTNVKLFDFIVIYNRVFIYVGAEFITAAKKYTPFYLKNFYMMSDLDIKEVHQIGDISIGFY